MRKVKLTGEVLLGEMELAARKCKEFNSLWHNLNRDYDMSESNEEFKQLLEYRYNRMVFMSEAKRNRYGNL